MDIRDDRHCQMFDKNSFELFLLVLFEKDERDQSILNGLCDKYVKIGTATNWMVCNNYFFQIININEAHFQMHK